MWLYLLQQGSLLTDDADHFDHHSLKDPMPGTSRSMMEMDAQHMIADDTFTGDPFERKCIVFVLLTGSLVRFWDPNWHLVHQFHIVEEPAAGLFEGELFSTDEPLDRSEMPPMGHDSDDDMDGGGWDAGSVGGHRYAKLYQVSIITINWG